MDQEQLLRIKSAMIIYALETSLGDYVLNKDDIESITAKNVDSIADREVARGQTLDRNDIQLLVEASYLDEIFNMAIDITKNTSFESKMFDLKKFCMFMNIFDIRNAISHPNRPFPDVYWFRAAAIASDPLILQLGLSEIRQALNAAISGNLTSPPDEWLSNVNWSIPNTLPSSFDHEITGLFGRDKETRDLEATLSKARNNLIALVAPGGVGKTALILQFLKDISLSLEWNNKIDAIVFCTLKNERLTADGIEVIEAINGINQIKDSIFDDLASLYSDKQFGNFEEACTVLDKEKILICIDNLETLLVHSQHEFIEFNQSLPLFWRVIVTSRISIDSATTVPLSTLVKRHAVNLSRSYFKRRGISDFRQEDLELIATKANNNPLAIRLTIDLYLKGVDISGSINKSQKDIASFSYTNLIESLSENSIAILESIYVTGESSKSELIDLLELSNEEISESLNELSKTSLIVRYTSETGNDLFNLSDSIRDLLLINPRNISIRNEISQNIKYRKVKIQEQLNRNHLLGINEFDFDFISSDIAESFRSLIIDLNRVLARPHNKRSHTELVRLKSRFSELIAYNSNNDELLFHYSRILQALQDESNTQIILEKAISLDKGNPRYLMAKALNYFHKKDYPIAQKIFDSLLDKQLNRPEKSSKKYAASLTKLHFLCLLFQGEYVKIIDETSDWRIDPDWSVMMGTYRASAFKRSVELNRNTDDIEKAFTEVLNIFNEIFRNEDYPLIACIEVNKMLKDLIHIGSDRLSFSEDFIYKYVTFIAEHFFNIVLNLKDQSIESSENKIFLEKLYSYSFKANPNPLTSSRWYSPEREEVYDDEHMRELRNDGFTIVKVYNLPEGNFGMSSYMFASDSQNNQFYLNVRKFDFGWIKWGYIKVGDKLAIKYDVLKKGSTTPATDIRIIDKFENAVT
ncbi:ATP-binding protein [Sphingobacterium sp. BN32]|uniref:ATP-binding protein n=1 Tax=Sphingobacterium sp. BN32 TaxID=3058432 RepID=UPI00265C92D0|nr:ATP-binding protein [Sphingobacterium sp. BN32]WKK58555.1 ATP-binding protein [Sphingobacterium sp. BN32]